ncbi:MAG: circadian clock protein KaiC [Acidobacteria bacterium]|nr:MAG: circadian clock protein KaiC [Acidobacteriota bacterium]
METPRTGAGRPRQETGIAGLDEILGGGLPSHRLYVVEGDPGSGKTTLALQFLLEGARRGQKCLYVTLSETLEELHDVAASHGWNLDGLNLLELNSIAERLADEANYTVFHASDVELGETLKRIRSEVERIDPARVALDSVSELKILSQTSVRYRREVLALKQFFAGRKCTVLILDDLTTREGEQQLQSIAHGVIRMEREPREYGTTRRQIHVAKMRAVEFTDGRHDFIIKRGGIEIYTRLTAAGGATVKRDGLVASGSAELDSLLGGGLDRGSSALLMGPAGSGKTTICSQYLIAALDRGERVACYLFEESPETFLKRADGLRMNFRPHLESGLFELVQADLAILSPGEFSSRAKEAVEMRNASLIVIDSLNGYLNGMPSERYLLIHMHELLNYLGRKGVATILTLAQHGIVGGTMHSPIDVSFLADTVMLLRYFEADGLVRQAVSIVKKRRGGHERSIREMRITSDGLLVGEVLKDFRGVLTGVPEYRGKSGELLADKAER